MTKVFSFGKMLFCIACMYLILKGAYYLYGLIIGWLARKEIDMSHFLGFFIILVGSFLIGAICAGLSNIIAPLIKNKTVFQALFGVIGGGLIFSWLTPVLRAVEWRNASIILSFISILAGMLIILAACVLSPFYQSPKSILNEKK